jgi:hypothetical protein
MATKELKTVKGTLLGIDGNAFAIMGHFSKVARREGWSKDEIKEVLDDAMSGDYNHLVYTINQRFTD